MATILEFGTTTPHIFFWNRCKLAEIYAPPLARGSKGQPSPDRTRRFFHTNFAGSHFWLGGNPHQIRGVNFYRKFC